MKRIIAVLLLVLLSVSLFACGKKTETTTTQSNITTTAQQAPQLVEVTTLDQAYQGVYLKDSTALKVEGTTLLYEGVQYKLYKDSNNKLVIKANVAGDLKEVSFANNSITVEGFGQFAKQTVATQGADVQGVYQAQGGTEIVVRSDSVTIDGEKFYLFSDTEGTYILTDDGKVRFSVNKEGETVNVTVGNATYGFESDTLPVDIDTSELVSMIKTLLNSYQTSSIPSFAHKLELTTKLNTTVLTNPTNKTNYKPKGGFGFLDGLDLSVTATAILKNLTLSDPTTALGEFTADATLSLNGSNTHNYAKANIQDGKVYSYSGEDEDSYRYSVSDFALSEDALEDFDTEDLPFLQILSMYTGVSFDDMEDSFDLDDLYEKIAEFEELFKTAGIGLDELEKIYNDFITANGDQITIDVNTAKIVLAVGKITTLIETKVKPALQVIYDSYKDTMFNEYKNFTEFQTETLKDLTEFVAEMTKFSTELTIREFHVEFNKETFVTSIRVDFDQNGKEYVGPEKEESDDQNPIYATYKNNVKVNLSVSKLANDTVTKVNPDDYIIDADDVNAVIQKYFENYTLPTFGANAEYDYSVRKNEEDDKEVKEVYIEINKLTKDEANAVIASLNTYFNISEDEAYETSMDYMVLGSENITTIRAYSYGYYEDYESQEEPSYYEINIYITEKPNNLGKVTTNIQSGITVTYKYSMGNNIYLDEYNTLQATVSWGNAEKALVVKDSKNNLMYYSTIDDDAEIREVYVSCKAGETYSFSLVNVEDVYDYCSVSYFDSGFETTTTHYGPEYVKAGDTFEVELTTKSYDGEQTPPTYVIIEDLDVRTVVQPGQKLTVRVPADFDENWLQIRFVDESNFNSQSEEE